MACLFNEWPVIIGNPVVNVCEVNFLIDFLIWNFTRLKLYEDPMSTYKFRFFLPSKPDFDLESINKLTSNFRFTSILKNSHNVFYFFPLLSRNLWRCDFSFRFFLRVFFPWLSKVLFFSFAHVRVCVCVFLVKVRLWSVVINENIFSVIFISVFT